MAQEFTDDEVDLILFPEKIVIHQADELDTEEFMLCAPFDKKPKKSKK